MIVYLLFVVAVYFLMNSSPRGRLILALQVGAHYDPKTHRVYLFLLPFLGIEWQREVRL